MQPLISVIVPVYNSREYLPDCIRSVLAQTFSRFELLLIDDGSWDDSRAFCEKMQETDSRLRYLPKEHSGVAAARNAGITAACGTYLFFLDSDDMIHPRLLETLFLLLEKHGCAMATEAFLYESSVTGLPPQWSAVPETGDNISTLLPGNKALDCFISEKPIKGLGGIGGYMIRRSIMQSILFDTALTLGEDTKFLYQLLSEGADLIVLNQKWYCYRTHGGQSSRISSAGAWQSIHTCQTYIRDRELAAGRIQNALVREGMLLTSMAAWHAQSRRFHNQDCREYLEQLARGECRWIHFSRVAFTARLSFFLSRRIPPLYRLVHVLWLWLEKLSG